MKLTRQIMAALLLVQLGMAQLSAIASADQPSLLSIQYHIADPSFCNAATCVDYDADGRRETLFASRRTGEIKMLRAANGTVVWSKKLEGDQESISAFDLDGDGRFEILYTVSKPGRLYVLDAEGKLLRSWDSGDWKLGNSAVILDADGDGVLDGLFGTRGNYLIRLNMNSLAPLVQRENWIQCGCHTTAMDVDRDGRWDLFAGSGDDHTAKGTLVRYDPLTLEPVWSYKTNDNASSADAVLADIDGDGQVEIIKSVDNYASDDAHDAIYAFEADGTLLWKRDGFAGEDSPNVADLDGDGEVELVGMTFGSVVYCLHGRGQLQWQKDLRPELDDSAHAYMTPILCDVDGDPEMEILAMTNGGYGGVESERASGVVVALSHRGEELGRLDVGGDRYWGNAYYANIDEDPFMELVVSGTNGMDVIQTRGYGPQTEHFQRRRNYQRLNVLPWAYEDSYFLYRGVREGVRHRTDNLVLEADGAGGRGGSFVTERLTLPPAGYFDRLEYDVHTPAGTDIAVHLLDEEGRRLKANVASGAELQIAQPVRIEFVLSASVPEATPILDAYKLSFNRDP